MPDPSAGVTKLSEKRQEFLDRYVKAELSEQLAIIAEYLGYALQETGDLHAAIAQLDEWVKGATGRVIGEHAQILVATEAAVARLGRMEETFVAQRAQNEEQHGVFAEGLLHLGEQGRTHERNAVDRHEEVKLLHEKLETKLGEKATSAETELLHQRLQVAEAQLEVAARGEQVQVLRAEQREAAHQARSSKMEAELEAAREKVLKAQADATAAQTALAEVKKGQTVMHAALSGIKQTATWSNAAKAIGVSAAASAEHWLPYLARVWHALFGG